MTSFVTLASQLHSLLTRRPEIVMPPLPAPPECLPHLEVRDDDTPEVVEKRLAVYKSAATPVEDFYRRAGVLLDFEITGGIPETTPRLMAALQPYINLSHGDAEEVVEEGQQQQAASA